MHDLLPAVEKNAREITQMAARALGFLGAGESMPGPALYLEVMRKVSDLRQVWVEHVRLLTEAYSSIPPTEARASILLRQFAQDVADTEHWLETLSSAGWPRTPEIGVNTVRVRVAQTLTTILRQMEKERTAIIPLLKKTPETKPVEVVKLMATA
jgi:hypothetical protein